MNVTSIGWYNLNLKQKLTSSKKAAGSSSSFIDNTSHNSYPIPFLGSVIAPLTLGELKFRDLQNIPCACCGIKMIPKSVLSLLDRDEPKEKSIEEFLKLIKNSSKLNKTHFKDELEETYKKYPNAQLDFALGVIGIDKLPEKTERYRYIKKTPLVYTKETIKIIKKYEKVLFPIERKVFEKIKILHKQNSEKTLPELMAILRPEHLKKLMATQLGIFNEIESIANGLSGKPKEKIFESIKSARSNIAANANREETFKRKTFLNQIHEIKQKFAEGELNQKEGELLELIQNKALNLPASSNSLDAFIVKYSGFKKVQENGIIRYKSRSTREIGQRLLVRSTNTIEHIKPKSQGGSNNPINYILECTDCNSSRNHTPLVQWVKLHPEMKTNCQRQIEFIMNGLKNKVKEFRGYAWYPEAIAKTLEEESNGAITIKLNKQEQNYSAACS